MLARVGATSERPQLYEVAPLGYVDSFESDKAFSGCIVIEGGFPRQTEPLNMAGSEGRAPDARDQSSLEGQE
jgi:hypothetical protein